MIICNNIDSEGIKISDVQYPSVQQPGQNAAGKYEERIKICQVSSQARRLLSHHLDFKERASQKIK